MSTPHTSVDPSSGVAPAATDPAAASQGAAIQFALDCMPYGVILVDGEAGVVAANRCGRNIQDLTPTP